MADANANRPFTENELLALKAKEALVENAKGEGIKNPEKLPMAEKVNPKTRMKEPNQVTRSVRTGNIITTR